jgi:hypothetical protein
VTKIDMTTSNSITSATPDTLDPAKLMSEIDKKALIKVVRCGSKVTKHDLELNQVILTISNIWRTLHEEQNLNYTAGCDQNWSCCSCSCSSDRRFWSSLSDWPEILHEDFWHDFRGGHPIDILTSEVAFGLYDLEMFDVFIDLFRLHDLKFCTKTSDTIFVGVIQLTFWPPRSCLAGCDIQQRDNWVHQNLIPVESGNFFHFHFCSLINQLSITHGAQFGYLT